MDSLWLVSFSFERSTAFLLFLFLFLIILLHFLCVVEELLAAPYLAHSTPDCNAIIPTDGARGGWPTV